MQIAAEPLHANELKRFGISGDVEQLEALFDKYGSSGGRIVKDPVPEQVEDACTAQLLKFYIANKDKHGFAQWPDELLDESPSLIGNLQILEMTDHHSFKYRLFGSKVSARYNRDDTGKEMPDHVNAIGVVFHSLYLAAGETGCTFYTRHRPPPESPVNACERVILPFFKEDGSLDRLVVSHLPYQFSLINRVNISEDLSRRLY